MLILTIDIGGTEIKSAIYNTSGELLKRFANQATQISAYDNHIVDQVHSICKNALVAHKISGVAIATAGVVNTVTGEIVYAGPTIPNYSGTNLKQSIAATFGLPCVVENDVNAVAMGESWLGVAQGASSTFFLTLGTGLGGALLIDGKIWHGANFSAGEIGHSPLPDGRRLEELASTSSMLKSYQYQRGETIDGKVFFTRLRNGESVAEKTFASMLEILVQGLLPVIYVFAPQMLVVGGGIAAQSDIIEPRLSKALSDKLQPCFAPESIRCATLGNTAGMVGALRYFLDTHQHLSTGD